MKKLAKKIHNDWIYGIYVGSAITLLASFMISSQLFKAMSTPSISLRYPYSRLLLLLVLGVLIFAVSFAMGRYKRHQIQSILFEGLYTIAKPEEKKGIVKPPYEFDIASWKVSGMMNYVNRSRRHVDEMMREFSEEGAELAQVEQELFMLRKWMETLVHELDYEEVRLSCVDIYYIFTKMNLYYVHKNKGIYESLKKDMSIPEQLRLDIFLDERTRDILKFKLKDRYAFLPIDFPKNMAESVRSMEQAADNGNRFAQYDLANVYLSSEFYGGMEAAIFYLYRACNDGHPSALAFIDRLRSA